MHIRAYIRANLSKVPACSMYTVYLRTLVAIDLYVRMIRMVCTFESGGPLGCKDRVYYAWIIEHG